MTRLRLGLGLAFPVGDDLRTALVRLAERCDVVELVDGARPPHAVVRSASDVPVPAGPPTLTWLDSPEQVGWASARTATAVLAAPSVARAARADGARVLALGPQERHADARPLSPFTRSRVRRARGLAGAPAVVRCVGGTWTWDGRPLDEAATQTAVAIASVLVTDSVDAALAGCAWATPVVASPAVARQLDLPAQTGGGDLDRTAGQVRDDAVELARLSVQGRALYEREHSPDRTVVELENLLARTPAGAPDPFGPTLDGLGTPADALIRRRAREALRDIWSVR